MLDRGDGELFVYRDANALTRSVVVHDGLVACVPIVPKDQRLRAHLRAIGRPGLGRLITHSRCAALVVHRRHRGARAFNEVDDRDQLQPIARQRHRPCVDLLAPGVASRWQGRRSSADRLVPQGAFHRIAALREDPLDPLIEEEARAVHELVQHAGGQIIRQVDTLTQAGPGRGGRRKVQGKRRWFSAHRLHSFVRPSTMMQGPSIGEYGFPSAVMTRSPRPSVGPRSTNNTWSSR